MSVDAVRWAWQQPVGKASLKLLLISLADRAGEDHTCFPSIDRLVADTELNRKTVIAGLKELAERGVIEPTGSKKGRTGRVPVYRLIGVEGREQIDPKPEQSQKRNHSENGIVPKTDANSPKNGTRNSPKNGTQNLLRRTTKEPPKGEAPILPEWIDPDTWRTYIEHRKKIKSPMTDDAESLALKKLGKMREAGEDPNEVLEQSVLNGWKGIFPAKERGQRSAGNDSNMGRSLAERRILG